MELHPTPIPPFIECTENFTDELNAFFAQKARNECIMIRLSVRTLNLKIIEFLAGHSISVLCAMSSREFWSAPAHLTTTLIEAKLQLHHIFERKFNRAHVCFVLNYQSLQETSGMINTYAQAAIAFIHIQSLST